MQRIDFCKRVLTMVLESKSIAQDSIAINHRASLNRYRQPGLQLRANGRASRAQTEWTEE